jgi:hypothetical protein
MSPLSPAFRNPFGVTVFMHGLTAFIGAPFIFQL